MARPALLPLATLLLTAGCGIGLDPLADVYGESFPYGDTGETDQVAVALTGRTYAAPMAEIQVIQPAGLQTLIDDYSGGALVFHVADEDLDRLSIAMTMGDDQGNQDICTPVFVLPEADWTTNPELEITGARTEIEIGGQPVGLENLDLQATVRQDGEAWESVHIRTLLDTRDLLGGSLPEGTDVCALVENMGGECRECSDGAEACAVLELQLVADQVDGSFDMDPSGC